MGLFINLSNIIRIISTLKERVLRIFCRDINLHIYNNIYTLIPGFYPGIFVFLDNFYYLWRNYIVLN